MLLTAIIAAEILPIHIQGDLEKLVSLPIADSLGVNVNESERERSGIICRQFCGVRRVAAIFRGAHMKVGVRIISASSQEWWALGTTSTTSSSGRSRMRWARRRAREVAVR